MRLIIATLLLAGTGLAWPLFQQSVTLLPRAFGPNETYKQILNPTHLTTLANRHNRAFQAVRRQRPVHQGGYRDPRSKSTVLVAKEPPRRTWPMLLPEGHGNGLLLNREHGRGQRRPHCGIRRRRPLAPFSHRFRINAVAGG